MEELLRARLQKGIQEHVFPGAVVGVVRRDGSRLLIAEGTFTYDPAGPKMESDTQFDVASITKSIPTSSIALKLIEEGKLALEDQIIKFLSEYNNNYREQVLIKHLLTYSIVLNFPVPGFSVQTATPADIRRNLLTVDLKYPPGEVAQYSNSPALLLAMVIEAVTGKTIDILADETFFKPLHMTRSTFFPSRAEAIPPTEIEEWRGTVQGVVHDETSFVLAREKASGCAGLFTNVPDILTFIEMLLNRGELNGKRYFSEETIEQMHTNQLTIPGQTMGLGWELADPKFMGAHFLPTTFGKTGFTGTLCLIDPERGIGFVLLSNRTYPKRTPADANQEVRRDVADIVFSNV